MRTGIVALLVLTLASMAVMATCKPSVVYYVYLPTPCIMEFVGWSDSTNVEIYNMSGGVPFKIGGLKISRMQQASLQINGSGMLKIASDKRLFISAYWVSGDRYAGGYVYYPCVDGGFLGKEFIFAPVGVHPFYEHQEKHVVFALDKSEVKIYDGKGGLVTSFTLEPYSYKVLDKRVLKPHEPYRLTSTGRVMLFTTRGHSAAHAPALEGGFSGKTFFAAPAVVDYGLLIIMGSGEAKAIAWGGTPQTYASGKISQGKPLVKVGIPGRGSLSYTLVRISGGEGSVIMGCFSAIWGSEAKWIGPDLDVFGCAGGKSVWVYVPDVKDAVAVVFIPFNRTTVEVDGGVATYDSDETIILGPGYHQVKSDKPVLLTAAYPSNGWSATGPGWAAVLLTPEDLEVSHEVPEPPERGGNNVVLYAAVAAALIMVAAVVLFKRMRK